MNFTQLQHAIRAACMYLQQSSVIVFGSQAILASYSDDQLPPAATMSREVDIYPMLALAGAADPSEIEDQLTILNVHVGEESDFHEIHGIFVEGVHRDTVILPWHWETRFVSVHVEVSESTGKTFTRAGLCLHPLDLCVAKGLAGRPKDHAFVGALLSDGLIDAVEILDHMDKYGIDWPVEYPESAVNAEAESRFRAWLAAQPPPL